MDCLEFLTKREQLMEDIISIMETQFPNEDVDEAIKLLCDSVCNNFPANWRVMGCHWFCCHSVALDAIAML